MLPSAALISEERPLSSVSRTRRASLIGWAVSLFAAVSLSVATEGAAAGPAVPPVRVPLPPPAFSDSVFAAWLVDFRPEAMEAGVSAATFDRALRGVSPDPEVIEADGAQPEFVRPIWDYLESALSERRVTRGTAELGRNEPLFAMLESSYGVEREVLTAIWGLESQYGDYMGRRSVVRSLATLAFDGRRADFGRTQLIAALLILQRGDISRMAMRGSWAGAMGHTQFIPTTYNAYAVDFDRDGRRDIWNSPADALASSANYLAASGWRSGAAWGHEVSVPPGFDYALADRSVRKPVSDWLHLGVTKADGSMFAESERESAAALILPAGHRGPAFLVLDNFRVVLRYNNATAYALAVNLLADRFRGRAGVTGSWPVDDRPLARSEREELQRLLTQRGFDTGGVDGIVGAGTRSAVRAYQQAIGVPADGYPTLMLLDRLRGG